MKHIFNCFIIAGNEAPVDYSLDDLTLEVFKTELDAKNYLAGNFDQNYIDLQKIRPAQLIWED